MEIPMLQEQETFLRNSGSSIFIADSINLFVNLQAQLHFNQMHVKNHNVWGRKVGIKMFFLAETSFT